MSNPLANLFGQPAQQGQNNIFNLMGQFQQFKNTFRGNPEQMVQELRRSGKMSEAQFQQLSTMANQLQHMFGNVVEIGEKLLGQ